MNQYTIKDFDIIDKQINQKLHELENIDQTNQKSILQRSREIIELERIKLENNKIQLEHKKLFASYIIGKINERVPSFKTSGAFFSLFSEDEKVIRGTNLQAKLSHEHDFDSDPNNPDLKKCSCGKIQFHGIDYDATPILETSDPTPKEEQKIAKRADPTKHPTSHYLFLVQINAMLLSKISKDMWTKYFDKKDPAKKSEKAVNMERGIRNAEKKVEEMKDLQAKLIYTSKIVDARQKIGPFEKLKAAILMDTTFNPSHVAKMLQITDKHAANTIKNKKIDLTHDLSWFKDIHLNCHECGNTCTYAIGDWYYEQTIRKSLGLTLTQPFS